MTPAPLFTAYVAVSCTFDIKTKNYPILHSNTQNTMVTCGLEDPSFP